jgi:hypothetical protein
MPSTFAGNYLKEPSDMAVVCTEHGIILTCDDPGGEDARDVDNWADLSVPQKAAIVAVMNSIIGPVEATINGYARRWGYAIPLYPLDTIVTELAARLAWISMRQRSGGLTSQAAEEEREVFRQGILEDLAMGKLILTAGDDSSSVAPQAHVYSFTDAASRDTTGMTPRMSRHTLRGF